MVQVFIIENSVLFWEKQSSDPTLWPNVFILLTCKKHRSENQPPKHLWVDFSSSVTHTHTNTEALTIHTIIPLHIALLPVHSYESVDKNTWHDNLTYYRGRIWGMDSSCKSGCILLLLQAMFSRKFRNYESFAHLYQDTAPIHISLNFQAQLYRFSAWNIWLIMTHMANRQAAVLNQTEVWEP